VQAIFALLERLDDVDKHTYYSAKIRAESDEEARQEGGSDASFERSVSTMVSRNVPHAKV